MRALFVVCIIVCASLVLCIKGRAAGRWYDFVNYTFHAGNVCLAGPGRPSSSPSSKICRSFAHFVLMVVPPSDSKAGVTSVLAGAARVSIDGGAFVPAQPPVFERHLVESDGNTSLSSLPSGVRSQMWNWGYDVRSHGDGILQLPSTICVELSFWADEDLVALGEPAVACQKFATLSEERAAEVEKVVVPVITLGSTSAATTVCEAAVSFFT